LEKHRTIEERCNLFAERGKTDPDWTFNSVIGFLQFQKERVEKREITGATLRNYIIARIDARDWEKRATNIAGVFLQCQETKKKIRHNQQYWCYKD
jgi:hypothetical protein